MFSKFLMITTTLMVISVSSIVVGIKTDQNLGSNWYVPTPTSATLAKTQTPEEAGSSYNYNVLNNNGQSSFLATSNFLNVNQAASAGESNNVANYYNLRQQLSSTADTPKQHQYLQYHPEGNAFHIYPMESTGLAEQRQEFLDPNINGLLPLGGEGQPADGDGSSIFDNLPTLGGITSGISGTASNIAQSIGLGSLGVLGSLIVLAIGGPLIVFAILFPAAIIVIAILGFPVLQLTLPPSDPNLARKLKSGVMDTARKAREILQSEECVERVSCVLARKSRTLPYENWILKKMDTISNTWVNRVSKSVKSGRAGEECQQFKCLPVTKMTTMYETFASSAAKYLRRL